MENKFLKIILGSNSLYRQRILQEMGYDFEIMTADIDEKAIRHEDPKQLTLILAKAKAEALLDKIKEPAILITSDLVIICNGKIREKPESEEEARDFLKSYNDYPATSVSSVVVTNTKTGKQLFAQDVTMVYFKDISDELIDRYLKEGRPFYEAGGFNITSPLLKDHIVKIEGSNEAMAGLSTEIVKELIEKISIS